MPDKLVARRVCAVDAAPASEVAEWLSICEETGLTLVSTYTVLEQGCQILYGVFRPQLKAWNEMDAIFDPQHKSLV